MNSVQAGPFLQVLSAWHSPLDFEGTSVVHVHMLPACAFGSELGTRNLVFRNASRRHLCVHAQLDRGAKSRLQST